MKRTHLLAACSLPVLLALTACDSGTVGTINSALNSGEDVDVNISTNDDGDLVISADPGAGGSGSADTAALGEAMALLEGLAADGGTPYDIDTALVYPDEFEIFIPSVTGVDLRLVSDRNPSGPTARIPMFRGLDPAGNSVDYVITEASDRDVATLMGIIYAPRMSLPRGTPGMQEVTISNGIMQFAGTVDFSPTRFVTPGDPTIPGSPNEITGAAFPPADLNPGAVADAAWSSQVMLPSGLVLNAQIVANSTGIHDRIPDSGQDDQSNPNLDRTNRFVVMQLLDGWQDGRRNYFHFVTDASVPDAAAIELGVFAPTVGLLPDAGFFPDGTRLGFAPSANGIPDPSGNLGQGLNISTIDQAIDPVNVFPIQPTDTRYTPMWDAHIYMWTADAIQNDERRIVTSIDDLRGLFEEGLVENFFPNSGPENDFIAGLMPTNAIINCPVIMQPDESLIGTTFGVFENY